MPVTIRSRLLLLVLSVLMPGIFGVAWLIGLTFESERVAHELMLRDTARALARVVDRELMQRAALARLLALSRQLDRDPPDQEALAQFELQARRALEGMQGWVELRSADRVLLDTRMPTGTTLRRLRSADDAGLVDVQQVQPLRVGSDGAFAALVQPIAHAGRTVYNVVVTLTPTELQRIIDELELPADWVGTVMDSRGIVVARHPGGATFVGRQATPDVRDRVLQRREEHFESVSLDGHRMTGYISLSPQGWAYVSAMPQGQFVGRLPQAVEHVVLAALALLTLAVGGALWVSRRIVGPVQALKQSAARMQAGLPVQMQPTGITECDEVSIALANAAESIQHARVELERQVAEAVERTRQAEQHISHSRRVEALGRLTGGVAHDFNNLLGVISNSAHLIRRHATQPAVQAPLAATLRAVEAGSRLTQHLLRFAGRRPLMPQTVTLTRWLPDMHEILSAVVGTRIEVDIEAEPDVRPLLTDPGELELALINLALNARDAMPGGGTLRLRARNARADETSALAPQAYVVLEVSDCGSGIEGDLSERVFEPFFTTKETGKGTGLGLSQVHGFCVQAGGTARLASTPDVGTTVTMILPAANANDAALSQPPGPALPAPPPALAGARVLLVEDNTELADVTAALLESYGARVRHATNAEQALAMLREQPGCDVVLSDVVMPGPMDGLALARLLRRERPELPVLLTTGYSMAARTAEAEFTVLRKPGSQQELLDALAEALQM